MEHFATYFIRCYVKNVAECDHVKIDSFLCCLKRIVIFLQKSVQNVLTIPCDSDAKDSLL